MSSFEWDETKRLRTLEKHGIDFIDAVMIFLGPRVEVPARSEVEERRFAIAPLNGVMISVVFTRRDETIRIITARVARKNERQQYQDLFDRRPEDDDGPDRLESPAE